MTKFFFSLFAVIFLLVVVWYYLPERFREHTTAFIKAAGDKNSQEAGRVLGDVILPENPKKRRDTIITELKKNLNEIKRLSQKPSLDLVADAKLQSSDDISSSVAIRKTDDVVAHAEKLLDELQQLSSNAPISSKIYNRVLDTLLPAPTTECKPR